MIGNNQWFAAILAPSLAWLAAAALLFAPSAASAYIGPGVGLSAVGSIVAVGVAVLIAVIGLVLFPLRLLLKSIRRNKATAADDQAIPANRSEPG